jgi:WD40 repeat protein
VSQSIKPVISKFKQEIKMSAQNNSDLLKPLASLPTPTTPSGTISFSPDSSLLAVARGTRNVNNDSGVITIWDMTTLRRIHTLNAHDEGINSIAFSPDGRFLASGSDDDKVKVWEVHSWEEVQTFSEHSNDVKAVAFSPDGKWLASGDRRSAINLWNVNTWRKTRQFFNDKRVTSLTFSPDSRFLASGDMNAIKLYDVIHGGELASLDHVGSDITAVAFNPNVPILASANLFGVLIWDLRQGGWIHNIESRDVYSVTFSPSGELFALSGHEIIICDANTWDEVQVINHHASSIAFNPEESLLVAGAGNSIALWYGGELTEELAAAAADV